MKKLLLIGTLVLAIGSSIVSGTTARYTQNLGEKTAIIKTKVFNVNAKLDGQFTDFEIEPKENKKFEFSVVNYEEFAGEKASSEVDMDVTFILEVMGKKAGDDNINKLLESLEIIVTSKGNSFDLEKQNKKGIPGDNKNKITLKGEEGKITGQASFKAGQASDKKFVVEVNCNSEDKEFLKLAKDDEVSMKLSVKATQK